jgi:hypothetical protein
MIDPRRVLRVNTTAPVRWRIDLVFPAWFDAKLCGFPVINLFVTASVEKRRTADNRGRTKRVYLPSPNEIVFSLDSIDL